jgi:hypothetical protein
VPVVFEMATWLAGEFIFLVSYGQLD